MLHLIVTFLIHTSVCVCVCVLSCFSHIWIFVKLWTIACQAPLSMGFSRQDRILEWVAMLSSRGSSLPRDGTRVSWIVGRFFLTGSLGKPHIHTYTYIHMHVSVYIYIHVYTHIHHIYIYTYHIAQQSSTFSVPGSGFEEDNVSMEQEWRGDGFRMILVRSTQPGSVICEVHSRICSTMRI